MSMDKAIIITILPFLGLVLLSGVVLLHLRRGKVLKLDLKGFGVSFSLSSTDGGNVKDVDKD